MVARALALLLALAALVYADVARRAYAAYGAGERYLAWHADPSLQRAHWDAWLARRETEYDAAVKAKTMDEAERAWRVKLARAERDERVAENPLKYAVRWFETAVDLFSTPPNPWAAKAAAALGPARDQWRRELAAAGVRLEDYPAR